MDKSYRIKIDPNQQETHNIKFNLKKSFTSLDILSLTLDNSGQYPLNCADYGLIAGRVTTNGGVGVPNAKVSYFIPLQEQDESNTELVKRYPYKNTYDVDENGYRYNLLFDQNIVDLPCYQSTGKMLTKADLNDPLNKEIFNKYYRYTTVTNEAGDYMMFVPRNEAAIIHMDVDLADIGQFSMKPFHFIEQGWSPNLFNNSSTFSSSDFNLSPNIISQDKTIDVRPFWGDESGIDCYESGITVVNFDIGNKIKTYGVFFGSVFGSSKTDGFGHKCDITSSINFVQDLFNTDKFGQFCRMVSGNGHIDVLRRVNETDNFTERIAQIAINEFGNWASLLECNLNKVVTDQQGNLIRSDDPSKGIGMSGMYRFRVVMYGNSAYRNYNRAAHLIPNFFDEFDFDDNTSDRNFYTINPNILYTVNQYIPKIKTERQFGNNATFEFRNLEDQCEGIRSFPYNRFEDSSAIGSLINEEDFRFHDDLINGSIFFPLWERKITFENNSLDIDTDEFCDCENNLDEQIRDIKIFTLTEGRYTDADFEHEFNHGIIYKKTDNLFYYKARTLKFRNTNNDNVVMAYDPPQQQTHSDINPPNDKRQFLFGKTGITKIGRVDQCPSLSFEPYIINFFPRTSFKWYIKDDDSNGQSDIKEYNKITELSQIGVTPIENSKWFDSDVSNFVNVRKYLCECFEFYDLKGSYESHIITNNGNTTDKDIIIDRCNPFASTATDHNGEFLGVEYKEGQGITNSEDEYRRITPYYFYFGLYEQQSSLDFVKSKYLFPCTDTSDLDLYG